MRKDLEQAIAENKKANKLYSTFGFRRMFSNVEKYLQHDENVLYARNANVQMDSSAALKPDAFFIRKKQPSIVIITDKRFLVYHRILPNEKLIQFPLEEIRSCDFSKDITSSKVRIVTLTKSIDIDLSCNSSEFELLNQVIAKAKINI